MLLVLGCSGLKSDQPILTAEFPHHLEKHIVDARIEGTEAGEDRQEMVDVGDHKLQIARSGQGSPTVVFESGLGSKEIERWSEMLERIGEITSAVCYARAGRLVGASFGALYIRVFAMRYPMDVAGLVLIDGVHERSQAASIMAKMEEGEDIVLLERTGMKDYFISGDLSIFGKLPDVPMVVMTSTLSKSEDYREVWRNLHSELFHMLLRIK